MCVRVLPRLVERFGVFYVWCFVIFVLIWLILPILVDEELLFIGDVIRIKNVHIESNSIITTFRFR